MRNPLEMSEAREAALSEDARQLLRHWREGRDGTLTGLEAGRYDAARRELLRALAEQIASAPRGAEVAEHVAEDFTATAAQAERELIEVMRSVPATVLVGDGEGAPARRRLLAALLAGLANGLSSGIVMTLGTDLAPPGRRGEFLGVWRLLTDAGSVLGPMGTTRVWTLCVTSSMMPVRCRMTYGAPL